MSTQLLKKRKKSLFNEKRSTENRWERFMFLFCFVLFCFVLFCFVLFCFCFFCEVLAGSLHTKKRKNRKLERTNTFMLTC